MDGFHCTRLFFEVVRKSYESGNGSRRSRGVRRFEADNTGVLVRAGASGNAVVEPALTPLK